MPIRDGSSRGNLRVMPANDRAVDVANQAIADILPVQQRRYDNAFQVQGFESIIYNRLKAGVPCSCHSQQKALAGLLDEQGKMPQGKINEMLTHGMEFHVDRYGDRPDRREPDGSLRSTIIKPTVKLGKVPGYTVVSADPSDPFADSVDSMNPQLGTNGPSSPHILDELVGDFDAFDSGFSDVSCGVCFGSGYVGGYVVVGGWRKILTSQHYEYCDGVINTNIKPFSFSCTQVDFEVVLPRGFISLDSLRIYNNTKALNVGSILIDDTAITYPLLFTSFDGLAHKVSVQFDEVTEFTHLEFQVNLSTMPMRVEFPKLQQSSDLSKLDLTEDVQINASPVVPKLEAQDVIIEMTFGKAFILGQVSWWNDRFRNVLGWDASARVVAPNEIVNLLPRRQIRGTNQRNTNPVRATISSP